jgi:DNA-binding response OmpR family regulator
MADAALLPTGDESVESLRLTVDSLKAALADTKADLPAEWRLTVTEARVFRVLLACDVSTRAAIAAGANLRNNRTIDVHVLRIRKKTARFGAEIETVRAKGWRLVNRNSWARSLAPAAA